MRKTFVGRKISANDRIRECMKEMVPILQDHFNSFISHGSIMTPRGDTCIVPNAVYTYPSGHINLSVVNRIDITYNDRIPNVFYERRDVEDCRSIISYGNRYNAVAIHVENIIAGYYLIDKKTLLLSDWTHSSDSVKVFKAIWPQLVEKLKLEKIDQTSVQNNIIVGCDPEFEVVDKSDNEIIEACDIITPSTSTEIGTDGSGDQVEFRPAPGTPRKVTQNIRKLIKKFDRNTNGNFDLIDTGDVYPLGGHIHIGVGFEMNPDFELMSLLDDFIGIPTRALSGSARSEYGHLSDHRAQPHGFEYRTPPAAVFQNPAISCIVLTLAKNLTKNYLNAATFEYDNRNLTLEDYMKYGGLTKQQAKYYITFCKKYNEIDSISKSWKVHKCLPRNNVPKLVFKDKWDSCVKEIIEKKLNTIRTDRPTTIVLYGLGKRKYGLGRSTIPIRCCATIPTEVWDKQNSMLSVGLSYDLRNQIRLPSSTFICGLTDAIKEKLTDVEA